MVKLSAYIYTDGSKAPEEGRVAASFYVPEYKYVARKRMQDHTSVFRAELTAILLALFWIDQLPSLYTGVVIFSDSLSGLQSIKSQKEENIIIEILIKCTHLYFKGISVNLEWIPGHCGITGNEIADKAAKHALQTPELDIENKLNKNEYNSVLKQYCYQIWQIKWEETNSPLRKLQRDVCNTYNSSLNNRGAESVIHCLRMGNIGLNDNLQKVNRHESGLCESCEVPETVEHFLCFCPKYIISRAMMMSETDLTNEENIPNLLNSSSASDQRALVNYVQRSQRFSY